MKTKKKRTPLEWLLIVTIILAVVEFFRTNTINGLCFSPVLPLLFILDDWDPQEWAQKKLEERNNETD